MPSVFIQCLFHTKLRTVYIHTRYCALIEGNFYTFRYYDSLIKLSGKHTYIDDFIFKHKLTLTNVSDLHKLRYGCCISPSHSVPRMV